MKSIWIGSLVVLLTLCVALPSSAQLHNPSFETGDLSGWSIASGSLTVDQSMPYGGQVPTNGFNLAYAVSNGGLADFVIYQKVAWSDPTAQVLVDISTAADGVSTSEYAGIRVGIDPNGGTNPASTNIVWSAITSHVNDQKWDVAGAAADGISTSQNTVFVQSMSDPYNDNGGWKIQIIDNVRLTTLSSTPVARNLSFEYGTLEGWMSHNSIDLMLGNWWPGPYGHAIAPVETSFGKVPADGNYFLHYAESGNNEKKCVLIQRFQTDIGNGIPGTVRAEVSINRDGSDGQHWDQDVKLGIDPTGGVDPEASTVNWSGRLDTLGQTGWVTLEHSVTDSFGSTATLFVENVPRWPFLNLFGIDNLTLYMDDVQYVEPVPTPTPVSSGIQSWSTYR